MIVGRQRCQSLYRLHFPTRGSFEKKAKHAQNTEFHLTGQAPDELLAGGSGRHLEYLDLRVGQLATNSSVQNG